MSLRDLVIRSAQNTPDAIAIKSADMSLSYKQLDRLANRFAYELAQRGVHVGDRVGIWLGKSADAVAVMQGVLRLRATYVPLDPLCPATRIRTIMQDCDMRVLVTTKRRAQTIQIPAHELQHLTCLCLDDEELMIHANNTLTETRLYKLEPAESDIAYILYTSGSTGKPKGVCISNHNALAFIEWASQMLEATSADRFANHAPFHFDLSVLDLYAAFHAGATTCLIADEISYMPSQLVNFLEQESPTIWYSVPSALILMMEQGELLETSYFYLRALLFAGEPFPIKYLRKLYNCYSPGTRFFNFYGPTETNVCTYYEVTELTDTWNKAIPIGVACSGDRVWARKEDGTLVQTGEEGELMVAGPTVMSGYWGQPEHEDRPYATGDLVKLLNDGNYLYIGRRDQMVKVRGHRIETGDIETALAEHPGIHEVAVTVVGTGIEARLVAFIVCTNGRQPSLLEIKRHCAERLPRYMIVDEVHNVTTLPRTRNGKLDRISLKT